MTCNQSFHLILGGFPKQTTTVVATSLKYAIKVPVLYDNGNVHTFPNPTNFISRLCHCPFFFWGAAAFSSTSTIIRQYFSNMKAAPGGYNSTRFPNANVVRSAAAARHKANAGGRRYKGNRRGPAHQQEMVRG